MRAQLTLALLSLYHVLVAASEYRQGSNFDSGKGWFQLGKEVQSVSWDSLLRSATKKSQSNDTLSVGKLNVSVSWSRALKRLSNKRRPVVIRNSPIKSWKALQLWSNTSYIANTVPNVNKVRKSSHPTFVYEDTTRMLGKYVDPATKTKFFENYVSTTKYKKVSMPMRRYLEKSGMVHVKDMDQNSGDIKLDSQQKVSSRSDESKKKKKVRKRKKQYYYYSRRLSEAKELNALLHDAEPRTFLQFQNVLEQKDRPKNLTNASVKAEPLESPLPVGDVHFWLTGTNITASVHYDRDHNFFAQVVGKKRFTLFEPSQWSELCVHPFYHSRDRQSQFIYFEHGENVVNINTKKHIEAAKQHKIKAYGHVDLGPGDLLYIPPFWWHRVETLEASIGINTWSAALETRMSTSLNDLNLPSILVQAKGKDKAAAASLFLRFIMERLREKCDGDSFPIHWNDFMAGVESGEKSRRSIFDFINSIVESRYVKMGLIERISGFKSCQFWDHGRCPKQHMFNAVELRTIRDHSNMIVDHVLLALSQILRKGDAGGVHSKGIVGPILGDYIERVATFTVGPERVCPFLRCVGHPLGWRNQQLKERVLDWGEL